MTAPQKGIPSASLLATMPDCELNDVGNAERLVFWHGENLRYSHAMSSWYYWDERRWVEDNSGEIYRRAEESIRNILWEQSIRPANAAHLAKHLAKSLNSGAVESAVKMARHKLNADIEKFDLDPWLLNCLNGTIDLRTGQLHPHNRSHLITKLVPIEYDPEAQCPTWQQFVESILLKRSTLVDFMQKAVGYALTGSTQEQCLFMLYGHGSNGKSTFLTLLTELFADYARTCPSEALMLKRDNGPTNDIARLRGSRFVTASESGEDRRLNEALVKQLTGTDVISARFLHKEFFDFQPQFKVFMATNHRPIVRGNDHGIWRRLHLIPFEARFWNPEKDESGEEQFRMNKDLPEVLRQEMQGILRWCVDGCLMWQESGLKVPDMVRDETKSYRASMDIIGQWIDDRCTVDHAKEYKTTLAKIYVDYAGWCQRAGENPVPKKTLTDRLIERSWIKAKDGTIGWHWKGVMLNEINHD